MYQLISVLLSLFYFPFRLSLVETIPENLTFSSGQGHLSTYAAWMQLLRSARTNVTISSFYWTLRGTENINDPTDNLVGLVPSISISFK